MVVANCSPQGTTVRSLVAPVPRIPVVVRFERSSEACRSLSSGTPAGGDGRPFDVDWKFVGGGKYSRAVCSYVPNS